jgi:hypothetical protein
VTPLDAVSNAVRNVALFVADRTFTDPPQRETRPATIEIISGARQPRRRARRSA